MGLRSLEIFLLSTVRESTFTRARGSVPGLGGLKETQMFLPHPRVKVSIVGSLRDRAVADRQTDRYFIDRKEKSLQTYLS